jgi:hypothetical protein
MEALPQVSRDVPSLYSLAKKRLWGLLPLDCQQELARAHAPPCQYVYTSSIGGQLLPGVFSTWANARLGARRFLKQRKSMPCCGCIDVARIAPIPLIRPLNGT